MYAVVNTGGKQAKVEKGSLIAVEKLNAKVGATVSLQVLMIADGENVLAKPSELAGASVTAEVLEHFKGEKQMVFKFKKRKGYKRTKGHRQMLTSLRILDIVAEGAEVKADKAPKSDKAPKAAAEKKAPKAAAEKAPAKEKSAPAEKSESPTAQCAALKSDGTQCTNKAKEGSKYCGVHAKKA